MNIDKCLKLKTSEGERVL